MGPKAKYILRLGHLLEKVEWIDEEVLGKINSLQAPWVGSCQDCWNSVACLESYSSLTAVLSVDFAHYTVVNFERGGFWN